MQDQILLKIIGAIAFSIYFVEIGVFHRRLKLNFKPFSCVPCLAAWSGLALYLLPSYISLIACVMFVPGVVATIIQNLMQRLWK